MTMRPRGTHRLHLLTRFVVPFLLFTSPEAAAQRSVMLQLNFTTRSGVALTWQSGSVVPPPGLPIFPDYQVHRSYDLENWAPIGEPFIGNIGGSSRLLSSVDSGADESGAFYRVEASVDLPFADLIGEELNGAELLGANLFGADLFSARLGNAILRDAILSGADLRFA